MNRQTWILLVVAFLIVTMLVFNKKVSLVRVFNKQLQVFKNARTGKISLWDITCFIIIPIIISLLIVFGLPYQIDIKLAEILTTVFSLVFTILFGFAAVIVERSESDNFKKKRVIGETFVSIVASTVLSLFAAIISILLIKIENNIAVSILSVILFTISFHIVMLLLMITKRTFVIYCEDE